MQFSALAHILLEDPTIRGFSTSFSTMYEFNKLKVKEY